MPKIFDCFTFFNELDLLEIRLNELNEVVDYFVIAESEETFTGKSKPLFLEKNYERYAKFHSKIIHVKIGRTASTLSSWDREHTQRNKLIEGLKTAEKDDIIILSDLDEVIDSEVVKGIRLKPPTAGEVYCLELRYFQFYLNLELPEPWIRSGPRVVLFKSLTNMSNLRSIRPRVDGFLRDLVRGVKASIKMRHITKRTIIPNAGWHFSWLGGDERVATKANSIPPHSNISDHLGSLSGAQQTISQAVKSLQLREVDHSFPKIIVENQKRYRHFILTTAD